jgi:hypothetical protein
MDEPKWKRNESLQKYGFNCECIACVKNFPTYSNFCNDGPFLENAKESYMKLNDLYYKNKLTPTFAKKTLQELLLILNSKSKKDSYAKDYEALSDGILTCFLAIAANGEKIP